MLTVITLLKVKSSPNGEQHGERPFWREFGEQYLDAWLSNVRRYVPDPKRIVVMSDDVIRIDVPPAVRAGTDIRVVPLDQHIDAPGFWAKLNMFRPEMSEGKSLYLDLDNVITGPLDQLCALEPDPLVMMDDRRVPRLPNGSAILFDAERCRGLWELYRNTRYSAERIFVARGDDFSMAYDQAFIAASVRLDTGRPVPLFQDLLPRDYCLNAYSELPQAEDWRDSRLIFGCGAAKPHTSTHPAFTLDAAERELGGW